LIWSPRHRRSLLWIGGPTKGLGTNESTNNCSLEAGSSFKRTQILVKLTPRFHGVDS
jgi:hypothetical protein